MRYVIRSFVIVDATDELPAAVVGDKVWEALRGLRVDMKVGLTELVPGAKIVDVIVHPPKESVL